jgi:DNA-binding MarR family transcriptional regulator
MTEKQRPQLDLLQFLPYRVSRLAERISHALSEIYRQRFGLTVPEWRVLAWLSQNETLTAKDICRLAYMDKATVSRAVQRLTERGLLERAPSPTDQRAQVLSLSDQAQVLLDELLPRASAWEARLLETLSAQERQTLQNVISKIERQISRMETEEQDRL